MAEDTSSANTMMPTLSDVLSELVSNIVKLSDQLEPSERRYLSVRIKTYLAYHHLEEDKLLCHFRVSSSCNLRVVQLIQEQGLSLLAKFLLHVQQDKVHCHCVLVTTSATSSNPAQPPVTTNISLTLTQKGSSGDQSQDHDSEGNISGEDNEKSRSFVKQCEEKRNTDREGSEPRKRITVHCQEIESSSSGGEGCKPGFSLHIRFHTDKMTTLKEGKMILEFLRGLKLFLPSVHISFALDIEGQKSRAHFRSEEGEEVQGLSITTNPQYLTRRATLTSRVFFGTAKGQGRCHVRCFACHVTSCKPLPRSNNTQAMVTVGMYDEDGVPMLVNATDILAEQLTDLVDWRQFGLAASTGSIQRPDRDGACLYLTVLDRSLLPAWAGSDHFVLVLNFLCTTLPELPVKDSAVRSHDVKPGESACHNDLAEATISALCQLYHPVARAGAGLQQNQNSSSRLDLLLPMMTESMAEIYGRSQNLQFRRDMEQLTQADSVHHMEATLRQRLHALLDPISVSLSPPTPLASNPRQEMNPTVHEEERGIRPLVTPSTTPESNPRQPCECSIQEQARGSGQAFLPRVAQAAHEESNQSRFNPRRENDPTFREKHDLNSQSFNLVRSGMQDVNGFTDDRHNLELSSASGQECDGRSGNIRLSEEQSGFEKSEELQFASQEEESWFSQMEQELTL